MPSTDPPPPRPTDPKVKFLGLAFAGADLAFEVDRTGVVTFAVGAVEQLTGLAPSAFVGQSWAGAVREEDAGLLESLLDGLGPGERRGPLRVGLRPRKAGGLKRFASLSVFRLPQNGEGLSCALSLGAAAGPGDLVHDAHGLLDRETFDQATASVVADAARSGRSVALALVQLSGLDGAMAGLDAGAAQAARQRINATLRLESYAGMGASEIAPERFAFVRSPDSPPGRISERLQRVCGQAVTPIAADLHLEPHAPAQSLRAVRYALDRYIEDGPRAVATGFNAMLERTTREAARFRSTLSAGAFSMVYQPVVDLAHDVPHHYEALVRFDGAESPAAAIQLAEEVGMIVDFDLAVARTVADVLAKGDRSLKIAINFSAISLMTPRCIDAFAALTAHDPRLRARLLVEITETQKLPDLAQANQVIAHLRRMGHPVCLDDFGAGAATLDYLSRLEVEFVKIDGRYVKGLDTRPRDAMVVRHVAALCKELGVATIAEMVETREAAAAIQALGVTLGQGWLYGKPTPRPAWSPPPAAGPARARRVGVVEQWG
jgi:EAL domain-containing protein (putative c-di-GMP-specific phosphodiesterase class I)